MSVYLRCSPRLLLGAVRPDWRWWGECACRNWVHACNVNPVTDLHWVLSYSVFPLSTFTEGDPSRCVSTVWLGWGPVRTRFPGLCVSGTCGLARPVAVGMVPYVDCARCGVLSGSLRSSSVVLTVRAPSSASSLSESLLPALGASVTGSTAVGRPPALPLALSQAWPSAFVASLCLLLLIYASSWIILKYACLCHRRHARVLVALRLHCCTSHRRLSWHPC